MESLDFDERVRRVVRDHKFSREEFVSTLMSCRMNWDCAIEEMLAERYYSTDSFVVSDSDSAI